MRTATSNKERFGSRLPSTGALPLSTTVSNSDCNCAAFSIQPDFRQMKSVFSNIKRRLSLEPKLSTPSPDDQLKPSELWSRSDAMLISGSIPSRQAKSTSDVSPLKSIKESNESVGPTRRTSGSVPASASARREPRKELSERSTTLKSKRSQATFTSGTELVEGKGVTVESVTPETVAAPVEKADQSTGQSTLDYMAIGKTDLRHLNLASSAKVDEDFTTLKRRYI